ncbi:MAG: transporter substrate-binding domain-containing protein [Pseudomonadota bacterium]|nr:transporter substrate-binding domain-containing protein [Pseudomonadota bacterium]
MKIVKHLLTLACLGALCLVLGCGGAQRAPTLKLVTENYPPITFMKDGKITGFATEVVQELLHRQNQPDNIRMMAWDDAYRLALQERNVVLFSTTRTDKREMLFKWVGPIGSYRDVLYAKRGSGIAIVNLEDARKVGGIGVVDGWFSKEFLLGLGFKNLKSTKDPIENARGLADGKLDLCAFTDITAPAILREAGVGMEDVFPAYPIKAYEFYIAFSRNTSDEIVNGWRRSLEDMKRDGTFERISRKWLPGGGAASK